MIKTKNLKKNYKSLQVLKGLDLDISKSEIVSIVGASGAGKTSLLQILGTLDKPSNNDCELIIDGSEVLSMSEKDLCKFRNNRIGFIFQFHQLLPGLLKFTCFCFYCKSKSGFYATNLVFTYNKSCNHFLVKV